MLGIAGRVPLHQAAFMQEYQVGRCVGGFCDAVQLAGVAKHAFRACLIISRACLVSDQLFEQGDSPGDTLAFFLAVRCAWGENSVNTRPVSLAKGDEDSFLAAGKVADGKVLR